MKKAQLAALEKVFSHEIDRAVTAHPHQIPFQSKAKVFKELAADGYLEAASAKVGVFPFTVTGWELTHAGRLAYCMSGEVPSE